MLTLSTVDNTYMNTATTANTTPVRFLRKKEVLHLTGLSSSSCYDLIARGLFPTQIKLSEKSVAWLLSDVLEWQAKRLAEHGLADSTKESSHD